MKWTVKDIPDQTGKVIIVTGANSGIGYEAAKALAGKGAEVVLACRNLEKGQVALESIREQHPKASVEVMKLDLSSLGKIYWFANQFSIRYNRLHVLINNAGVMNLPYRQTSDGFEMQFGVNHLGHFCLTGKLLEELILTKEARVVTVSSLLHRRGKIPFDDLHAEKKYSERGAYSNSKLANLLFTYEFQRRLTASGASTMSVACHPGYSATNLQLVGPEMKKSWLRTKLAIFLNNYVAQSAEMGALPTLYAATAPDIEGGDYIGPAGRYELKGYPTKVQSNELSHNRKLAAKLWFTSETLTGVQYRL